MTYETTTSGPSATQSLAKRLAQVLPDTLVIELISDLGGGKTTFVQGLAAGLGFTGPVTSPTFTLSNIYPLAGDRQLHHYDLYRLGEAGIVGDELREDMAQEGVITVIEWAAIAHNQLPRERLVVSIIAIGETDRQFKFAGQGQPAERIIKELSR